MRFCEVRFRRKIFKKARYSKNVQNSRSSKRRADCKISADKAGKVERYGQKHKNTGLKHENIRKTRIAQDVRRKAEPRVIDYNHQMRAPPRRYGRKSILRRKKQ